MGVTPHQTATHVRGLAAAESRRGADRAQVLLARAPQARALLVDRYGARRVWIFGSLIQGGATSQSDVDVAVLGLDGALYFDALAALTTLFGAPVDLVCLERAPQSLQERVVAEGREL